MDEKNTRDLQELEPFEEPVETDPTEAVEEGEPYFPPTDPVVRTGRGGRVEIANGFDSAEVPEIRPAAAASAVVPSDGALEDAIRMELALDASTAYLDIRVSVADAVATLEGEVADAVDAENAVAVAGRVPGVSDVVDELRVT